MLALAKEVSARVALFNMVGFVKLFQTSVARKISRKVEPLSTSAMARNGCSGEKNEFHRVTPFRESHWKILRVGGTCIKSQKF